MGIGEAKHPDLSRAVSHALRHEPWLYELELDGEGWVGISTLVDSLQANRQEWYGLEESDLIQMIESSEKRRHETKEGRIRAIYGHSIPQRLSRVATSPPEVLFHGTDPRSIESIQEYGLRPMSRQNVHLSIDEATAKEVGRRKSKDAVILKVNAGEASEKGVVFYMGNEKVWLADHVPSEFIEF
jgi:putative RNA 2'-phosphotransferase